MEVLNRTRTQPPDGGWGYAVVLASSIIMIVTIVPLAGLGIILGGFLEDIREDATNSITLISSTYNTISFFMGIVTNVLLQRFSYRKVALLGSVINFAGALVTVFTPSLNLLIISYGVLQGVGFGLLLPASMSAFNAYFTRKMALMVSVSQAALVAGYMAVPHLSNWCLATYGYRGTLLLLAALAAFCFPASMALQPVRWHSKPAERHSECSEEGVVSGEEDCLNRRGSRRRRSSAVLGERVASLVSLKLEHPPRNATFWEALLENLDLHLLRDWRYLNIAVGLSLSFTADIAFFPIIPSIMAPQGFDASQIALMISVFFTADLVARVALTLLAGFLPINSRLTILVACALSAALRLALPMQNWFNYKLAVLAAMGFMRCFIQTPQTLVISDNYPDNFESAYSLYMVINGVVTLIYGALISCIKTFTGSDDWVCHSLTAGFAAVVVTWGAELLVTPKKTFPSETITSKFKE